MWVATTIPVKLANGTWKVKVDYSSINKVCAKDIYPFPKEGEGLASIMGYPYKCFLRLLKDYSQIRMAKDNEEKTRFRTEERVYCFIHMPKELKNSADTLQKMMKKIGKDLIHASYLSPDRYKEWRYATPQRKRWGNVQPKQEASGKINPNTKGSEVILGKKTIEEGSGVGIILVSPEERKHSYAIHLKFNTSDHAINCEALLARLAASLSKRMKDLHVSMDSPKLVAQTEGNHTPATEQERKYKKEIIDATTPFHRTARFPHDNATDANIIKM
ncbi:hypothetical protein Tco_0523996 [Tanacetum coccineum]